MSEVSGKVTIPAAPKGYELEINGVRTECPAIAKPGDRIELVRVSEVTSDPESITILWSSA